MIVALSEEFLEKFSVRTEENWEPLLLLRG